MSRKTEGAPQKVKNFELRNKLLLTRSSFSYTQNFYLQ